MSTSFLYHGFGIPTGYVYQSTLFQKGTIIFKIKEKPEHLRCSVCRSQHVILRGSHTRRFLMPPIGRHSVYLEHDVARVECKDCSAVKQVRIRYADGSKRYTRRFHQHILDLSRRMTIKDVAEHLKISWDTVKDIQKIRLKSRYARPNIKKLKRIAIDEIYMGKKQGYLTVVLDLEHEGAIVHVGEGKSGNALVSFWKRLARAKVKLDAVATDMGSAFIKSARDKQPEAVNVVDHFHVIKLYNEKLTKLRRDLQRDAETEEAKTVLKGTRWLLMLNDKNLAKKPESARDKLQKALELNEPLSKAYYLKEALSMLWKHDNKESARKALIEWINMAHESGIAVLKSFAKTLGRLKDAVLAFYDFDGLSSGPMEGTNNKIKTLHKIAYGYRDIEFFKLKILAMHESRKDAFAG